ncbi:MAG: AAA family ATPase [bacterium]
MESQRLFIKYRPKNFEGVVGQEKAVRQIRALLARGWGGRAWWFSGASGVGKSTLAQIIADLGADELYTLEIAGDELTTDCLDDFRRNSAQTAMDFHGRGRGGRCLIVNEAHGIRPAIIRKLLVMLEEQLPAHVVLIFTTTSIAQTDIFDARIDASPLLSRCSVIELTNQGLADKFAALAWDIAQKEHLDGGLNGPGIKSCKKLLVKNRNNLRHVLNEIERGALEEMHNSK